MRFPRLLGIAVAALILSGCTSPEATRTRGGDQGADVGNRKDEVRMHLGALPYWKTPKLIPAEHPPLEPARQAAQLSRE